MEKLQWRGPMAIFDVTWTFDGVEHGDWRPVAVVVKSGLLDRVPIVPYPSGRQRYLYIAALRNPDRVLSVHKSLRTAQAACERAYFEGKHKAQGC